jgi:tRNA 2-(methylsulfanyl)-N6-isopentenyladenosine37 hydroxylase
MFCLTVPSDPAWTAAALTGLDAVLADHAHCEMKAASNALSLAARHPQIPRVVLALTHLAHEEICHFQEVYGWLCRRNIALGPPPKDLYAGALRRALKDLEPSPLPPLVDRLLVAALIEARSCERFKMLALVLEGESLAELRDFYARLFVAEARHYRTFVDLAALAAGGELAKMEARLRNLAVVEGAIVTGLSRETSNPSVHG